MHSFEIGDQKIQIDESMPLDEMKFLEIKNVLKNANFNDILQVAFVLRSNFEESKSLFNMAYSKAKENSERETAQAYLIGLMLQHNQDVRALLEEFYIPGDKRYDFLKGIFLMRNAQYSDSEFCFESAGFKKGLELCKVLKNDIAEMEKSPDPVIQCYLSSKNWKRFNKETFNKDFMYVIGKSDEYSNEANVDVQLTIFNKKLNEIISKETLRKGEMIDSDKLDNGVYCLKRDSFYIELYKKDIDDLIKEMEAFAVYSKPSAYVFYLIGKMFHLIKDFSQAQNWYNKSLSLDSYYLPAQFNLCKINETPFEVPTKNTCIHDFNALLSLKNSIYDYDFSQCSNHIRKLYRTIVQARKLDRSVVNNLLDFKYLFDEFDLENNIAIINEGSESIEKLEFLLQKANEIYKEHILYNLAVMKKDLSILKECHLPEAQLQIDFLTKNLKTENKTLLAYLTRDKKMVEDDTFGHILSGYIYVDEYLDHFDKSRNDHQNLILEHINLLDRAEECFCKEKHSFYSINGLGICAILRGNVSAAEKLFEQIGNYAKKNLANCYILLKDYPKAAELYLKNVRIPISGKDYEIIKFLGFNIKDLKLLTAMIDLGIEELKNHLAMVYLSNGDIKMAQELKVSDSEVESKIQQALSKEEERKRKIAEIEEYRKRQKH